MKQIYIIWGGWKALERSIVLLILQKSGKIMCQGGKPDTGKFHSSYIGMNVCGSACEGECVVDGMYAMAAD